jgi:hypothetical protein
MSKHCFSWLTMEDSLVCQIFQDRLEVGLRLDLNLDECLKGSGGGSKLKLYL